MHRETWVALGKGGAPFTGFPGKLPSGTVFRDLRICWKSLVIKPALFQLTFDCTLRSVGKQRHSPCPGAVGAAALSIGRASLPWADTTA